MDFKRIIKSLVMSGIIAIFIYLVAGESTFGFWILFSYMLYKFDNKEIREEFDDKSDNNENKENEDKEIRIR